MGAAHVYYDIPMKFRESSNIIMPWTEALTLDSHNKTETEDSLNIFLIVSHVGRSYMCMCVYFLNGKVLERNIQNSLIRSHLVLYLKEEKEIAKV